MIEGREQYHREDGDEEDAAPIERDTPGPGCAWLGRAGGEVDLHFVPVLFVTRLEAERFFADGCRERDELDGFSFRLTLHEAIHDGLARCSAVVPAAILLQMGDGDAVERIALGAGGDRDVGVDGVGFVFAGGGNTADVERCHCRVLFDKRHLH